MDEKQVASGYTGFKSFWNYIRPKLLSFNIGHLLLIFLALHLFAMSFPSDGGTVWDESYYVGSSNHFDQDLLHLVPSNLEHPFFGKVWGALGIYFFGYNFFGWRIFYVIIGVVAVWLFYELALVFFSKDKALFAASMLGLETMFFFHTTLALLEGPPLLFALASFLLYFKKHYYLSALCMGLCVLSKEWGVYFLIGLVLYHLAVSFHNLFKGRVSAPQLASNRNLWMLFVFLLIVAAVDLGSLWVYDLIYRPVVNSVLVTNPLQNWGYYISYQSSLTCNTGFDPSLPTCTTSSWNYDPWRWIIPYNVTPSNYYSAGPTGGPPQIQWLGIGNFIVWYSIWLIVPILIVKGITRKIGRIDLLVSAWIASTYLPWFFISIFLHRVEYAFYMVNVDPGLALGIPLIFTFVAPNDKTTQKFLMAVWIIAAVAVFVYFFPVKVLGFGS
jgi:dolichyl-phosphate-mannose-protein mannosyltransferase